MMQIELGRTGIKVSKIGIGTGTAGANGQPVQRGMSVVELADILIYAYDKGINFWDSARAYGTYIHIKEALKTISREKVVIVTKLASETSRNTRLWLEECLRSLGTDYVDVCLMHGVRNRNEFLKRQPELETMISFKGEGKVRAVGLSSHGLEALDAGLAAEGVDVVWGRVNLAGCHMDTRSLGFYDSLAAVPLIKRVYNFLPDSIKSVIRPKTSGVSVNKEDYMEAERLLQAIHDASKGVVGMKVIGEGLLMDTAEEALRFVMTKKYIDSVIIGMLNREEVDKNCEVVESYLYQTKASS